MASNAPELNGSVRLRSASTAQVFTRWRESAVAMLHKPLTPYYLLIGATGMLLTLGLMEVLSASSVNAYKVYGNSYYWFTKQLIFVCIGIPAAWVVSRFPTKWLRILSWVGIFVSIIGVALVKTSLGVTVNGNTNWIAVGPLQIQPAEIAKFSLVVWAADVYARKDKHLGDWRHALIPVLPVFLLVTGMIVGFGHDLGTGLIMGAILVGLLWVVGAPGRLFTGVLSVAAVLAMVLAATNKNRMDRLTSFTDPFGHFGDHGWQAGHGILGMASGGLFGKGIGASQQKWGSLPEPHTDFIFAVLGEELGLVGTLLVLALFLAIAYAGYRIAVQTKDPFVRYVTAGIVIWMTVQMLINIGMVLALFPVIGLPLPFVSYGGSSLVIELVSMGLLISFARREPAAARELRARKRARKVNRVKQGRVETGR